MGFAGRPASEASSAVSSPTMKLTGTDATRHRMRSLRSASAAAIDERSRRASRATAIDDLARTDGGRGGEGSVEDEVRGEP